jgi:hypothetical protein
MSKKNTPPRPDVFLLSSPTDWLLLCRQTSMEQNPLFRSCFSGITTELQKGIRFDAIGTGANMALHQSEVWRGNSDTGEQRLDRRFESPVHLRQHHEKALLKTTTSTS